MLRSVLYVTLKLLAVAALVVIFCGCTRSAGRPIWDKNPPAGAKLVNYIEWSPSGRWIAVETLAEKPAIVIVDTTSGDVMTLRDDSGLGDVDFIGWRPDLDKFYYITSNASSRILYGVSPSNPNGQQDVIKLPPFRLASGAVWMDDGSLFLVDNEVDHHRPRLTEASLVVISPQQSVVRQFSLKYPAGEGQLDPDQPKRVIVGAGDAPKMRLVRVDHKAQKVENAVEIDGIQHGSWRQFPGGRTYFVYDGPQSGKLVPGGLYKYAWQDRKVTVVAGRELFPGPIKRGVGWQDEAEMAAVSSGDFIFSVDLRTGTVKKLTLGPSDRSPAFSQDGRKLAFVRDRLQIIALDLKTGKSDTVADFQ